MNDKHKQLQDVAIGWLYGSGCSIFAKEVPTQNGNADALGIKTLHGKDDVYYLECKASRADLICKKQKKVYKQSIGAFEKLCYLHTYRNLNGKLAEGHEQCEECKRLNDLRGDTGIDFYYFVLARGVKIEKELYPEWGVIDEEGLVRRKAKRMKRNERANRDLIVAVAHVLVYKVYGKMYGG